MAPPPPPFIPKHWSFFGGCHVPPVSLSQPNASLQHPGSQLVAFVAPTLQLQFSVQAFVSLVAFKWWKIQENFDLERDSSLNAKQLHPLLTRPHTVVARSAHWYHRVQGFSWAFNCVPSQKDPPPMCWCQGPSHLGPDSSTSVKIKATTDNQGWHFYTENINTPTSLLSEMCTRHQSCKFEKHVKS